MKKYKVKRGVGIDNDSEKINLAKKLPGEFICQDVKDSDISDATVILFWFTEEEILKKMMKSWFSRLRRII